MQYPFYIRSASCISPQYTFDELDNLFTGSEIQHTTQNVLYCIEPDFKAFINPVQIRRMSRALKIGFSAAIDCLHKSGDAPIDAIIVGTGKGCLVDTETFLHSIREFNETALNPTHFIHSTYNQLNGMIALSQKINSYNVTYVHRGFSFEHTLLDAALLFSEGEAEHVLAGTFDQMTVEHFSVKNSWGFWKQESINSLDLLRSSTRGTIAGEGSSFYVLAKERSNDQQVAVCGVQTLYRPSKEDLDLAINELLQVNGLQAADIDIILSGNNGNNSQYHCQSELAAKFPEAVFLYFKHLCGEFDTASQFGFWMAVQILTRQSVPDILFHPAETPRDIGRPIKYVLLYNNYFEANQSVILLGI